MTFADISIRIEITQISASKPALQARWRSGGGQYGSKTFGFIGACSRKLRRGGQLRSFASCSSGTRSAQDRGTSSSW
eukprot:symbB.v1.2.041544.t1/scaffold8317.1/size6842/1